MKINEKLDISISQYLGKLEKGVVALLSVMYEDKSYEGTYWYDGQYKVITLDMELSEIIGDIQEYGDYDIIIEYLDENTSDYEEIYPTLEEVDH